jgi:tetratricopeptide (TPR) repeat protein
MGIDKNNQDKYSCLDRCFWLSYRTIEGSDADRLFQAAALFPAGFTLEDMEELLPGLAFHHLITLESKSLLQQQKQGEFSMLAPLRHYAFQIFLHHPRPNDMEKHWLALVIAKAQEYENTTCGSGRKKLNQLISELPNIYMPLDYLLKEVSRFKDIKDNIFKLLGNIVDFLRFQGIYQQTKGYLNIAGQLAREAADTANEAYCIYKLGEILFDESQNQDAIKAFQQALPLYKKIGDLLGEANCIKDFGRIQIKEGNIKKGKNHLEQALNLYNTINSQYSIANAYYEYALLLKELKGYKKDAHQLFQKAADIFTAIDLPQYVEECKKYLSTG